MATYRTRCHVTVRRTYQYAGASWVVNVDVSTGNGRCFPHDKETRRFITQHQMIAFAVVDDFGSLVYITEWQ